MIRSFVLALLLSACITPRYYPIRVTQTLQHGSDRAILAGCERGVLRWHRSLTGSYPTLDQVALFCEDVRRTFQPGMRDGGIGKA